MSTVVLGQQPSAPSEAPAQLHPAFCARAPQPTRTPNPGQPTHLRPWEELSHAMQGLQADPARRHAHRPHALDGALCGACVQRGKRGAGQALQGHRARVERHLRRCSARVYACASACMLGDSARVHACVGDSAASPLASAAAGAQRV